VLVRTDIPIADQIVQVGHACLEAGSRFAQPSPPSHLVVLAVSSEARLHHAIARIQLAGIRCAVFHEPDDDMGDSAACTEPVSDAHRRIFKRHALWNDPAARQTTRGPPPRV
jgi:hypothetical protein